MADFQQSLFTKRKISNGNAYDDIFGGPPKYSVPSLSSRVDDYSEIFGNFFAPRTSSIPILDFPLLDEDQVSLDVSSTKFDYTEIFGGFDAGDFAVPYEEMLSEQQGPQNPSRNSWSQAEGATQQTPEIVSTAPLEMDNQDLFVNSKMKQSFSNGTSEHIFDGTKQFNVSYNKSNQGSQGEPRSGTTHIAHLHDVPGFTVLVDSCPPLNMNTYDNSVDPKNDISPKEDSNGEIMEENHSREMSSHILGSNVVAKTSENEIIPDEQHLCSKQFDEKDVIESGNSNTHDFSSEMPSVQKADLRQIHLQSTASEAASAGDQHNSCNPIADLPSNGDKPFEKVVFLTISDINLRTQPSQLPPPSRPPPKLGSSKKLKAYQNELYSRKPMRTTETYHFGSAFDTCTLLENNASLPFFDVEVDASSAAAASAAAMREAMEKAQVKLKSAKESMERKRDGHQGRMKLNLNEDQNINEQRMSRSNHENRTFKDEEALDSCDRRHAEIKDSTRVDRWKMMSTADMASEYEWKMGHSEPTGASMDKWQGKNFRGSLDALKQEERAGEWKVEKQYYELINNEKTFRVTADQENYENNLKSVGWNPMRASKAVKEEGILKNNETFKALKESYLQEDCNQKPKVGKTACQLQENDNDTRPYTQDRVVVKKEKNLQTSQEALDKERLRWKVDNMVYEHNENEYGLNEACGNEEGGRGLKLAFEHEREEKRWEAAHECVDHENGRKVAHMCKQEEQRLKATCEHKEEEKRLKAAHKHEEEEKGLEAAHKHEEEEKRLKAAHEHEEEERRLKAARKCEEEEKWTKAAREREEEEKRLKVAHEREEEEKKLKAAYEREEEDRRLKAARKCEEEEKRLKAARELEEEEKRLKAARECEEEEKRLKAACEHEEEEKRLKVARKLEDEKRLEAAFVREEEEKRLSTACMHVWEEKGPKETHEHKEDILKCACETEEEKKRLTAVHLEEDEKRLEATCIKGLERETVKASHVREEEEKVKTENQNEKERQKYEHEEEENKCKKAYDTCDTEGHGKNSKATKDTYKQWINLKVVEEADEWEENGAKLKPLHNVHENEEDEKKNATVRQQEESEKLLKMAKTTQCCADVNDKKGSNEKLKEVQDTGPKENRKMMKVDSRLLQDKENEQRVKEARMGGGHDGNGTMLKTAYKVLEEEIESKQTMTCEKIENLEEGNSIPLWPGEGRKLKGIHDAHVQAYNEKEPKTGQAAMKQEKNDDKLKVVRAANGLMVDESSIKEFKLPLDKEKGSNKITSARKIIMEAENRRKETVQFDRAMNGGEKIVRTPQLAQGREREEKSMDKTYDREEREKEERLLREREVEKERLRKLEEEREREREREKDRLAVERATREARERASTEARERAERAAVERALAEARQRALADARERAEKASLAEKASSEAARLRVERAAVERATAEARERAAEKAVERAAERAAARDKTDSASRQNPASDVQDFRGTQGESALRSKARLERHQRTVERAAKALAEKNVRDILSQREQTERNRLAETLDADIRRWASGKEGNLRALLSTLQYILGPESGWQPIPLTDVITAVAVKKAYRKATLCVHPDKVQQRGASIQHKYICEKVFDLLKEAWSRFNSEER